VRHCTVERLVSRRDILCRFRRQPRCLFLLAATTAIPPNSDVSSVASQAFAAPQLGNANTVHGAPSRSTDDTEASHDGTSAVKSGHGGASVAESHRGTLERLWEMLGLSAVSSDMPSSAVADRKPMTEDGGLKKKAVRLGALNGLAARAEEAAAT